MQKNVQFWNLHKVLCTSVKVMPVLSKFFKFGLLDFHWMCQQLRVCENWFNWSYMLLRAVNEKFPAFTFFCPFRTKFKWNLIDRCRQRVAQKMRNSQGVRISVVPNLLYSSPTDGGKCISVHTCHISLWFGWSSVEEFHVLTMMLSFFAEKGTGRLCYQVLQL